MRYALTFAGFSESSCKFEISVSELSVFLVDFLSYPVSAFFVLDFSMLCFDGGPNFYDDATLAHASISPSPSADCMTRSHEMEGEEQSTSP